MSVKHTKTTIGTKPLESIIAEFRASIGPAALRTPPGPGWVEVTVLRAKLGLGETAFSELAVKMLRAGAWERVIGTKLNDTGEIRSTRYYRVKPRGGDKPSPP